VKKALARHGVAASVAGHDTNPSQFRDPGKVTLASIFRAKGNEAWKVYAARFHYVTNPQVWKKETELQKRNEAFVALTRARLWCVVTGLHDPVFDELRAAKEMYPRLTFPAFNQATLRRVMDDGPAAAPGLWEQF
jgi:superfamily I DNA and RNA helicase